MEIGAFACRATSALAATAALAIFAGASAQAQQGPPPVAVVVTNPVTLNPTKPNPVILSPNAPNPVTIVNPSGAPPSTVTVANPVTAAAIATALGIGTPFSTSQQCDSHGSFCTADFAAPSNQRMLVEYIALFCGNNDASAPLPQIHVQADLIRPSATQGFPIDQRFGINQPSGAPGDPTLSFAQFTRLYVDPGTTLELAVVAGNTATMTCSFGVSGQNIDAS